MKIVVEFIPGEDMRYPSCGDYWIDQNGDWQIRVSKMSDWRSEIEVSIHELWEMALVVHHKIPMESIDKFDIAYEHQRMPGDDSEPGDSEKAPYHEEHTSATSAERFMCEALGMRWAEHSKIVEQSLE